jgi:ABC-type phosphate transport system auxiliary subunit
MTAVEDWEVEELERWKEEFNSPLKKEEELIQELAGLKLRRRILNTINTAPLKDMIEDQNEIVESRIKKVKHKLEKLRASDEYDTSKRLAEYIDDFKRRQDQYRALTT